MANPVAHVLLPGDENPTSFMKSGTFSISWTGKDGKSKMIRRFRERAPQRIVDDNLCLPTLYLHTLDPSFLHEEGEMNVLLRSGNDNAEVRMVLPPKYVSGPIQLENADLGQKLNVVLDFLRGQGEVQVGPSQPWSTAVSAGRLSFSLKAARPKAEVNLDKKAFGIPVSADLYLFAQNHASVAHMDDEEQDAFEACIDGLPEAKGKNMADVDLQKLGTFLKIFYEGGFGYNKREYLGREKGPYLPKNVAICALGVVPAFEGQAGIVTGYPYALEARFLPFIDTVPVTIGGIREMSSRHQRYGLCFTRDVAVWEGEQYASEQVLDFCCVMPYGGFYYTPKTLKEHRASGGLVYAFGEDRSMLNACAMSCDM